MAAMAANLVALVAVLQAVVGLVPDAVVDARSQVASDYDTEPLFYFDAGQSVHASPAGATVRLRVALQPPRPTVEAVDGAVRAALARDGWELLTPSGTLVARKVVAGATLWWKSAASSGDCRVVLVRAGPPPHTLTLSPPGANGETIGDGEDFPFLGHYPGATLLRSGQSPATLNATAPGAQPEVLIAPPLAEKRYALPPTLSPFERMTLYRDGLQAAGWTIVRAQAGSDAQVIAHYAQNGRDVYVAIHDGDVLVGDVGARNAAKQLAEQLTKDGHVAIYGIYFASDEATLQPASDAALHHVLELLQADAALKLEIQGHTDSSGTAAHNLQLSAARAQSVLAWLVAHGVAAARLTTRGLGQTVPVADNATLEGRARNRRVELAKVP